MPTHHFCCISDKNAYPGSNHEETTKSNWAAFLKKIVSVHFKNVKIMKQQSVAEVVQMRHDN